MSHISGVAEQVSVRLNDEQKQMLDNCQSSYPAMSRSGLFLQLLYEWTWSREAGNSKSARLERIERELAEVKAMVAELMAARRLELYDTDHG